MTAPEDNWLVGKAQQDYGEPDTFDGTVWATPTEREIQAEREGEGRADCYLVAEGIRHEPYARLIAAAPDLLRACKLVVERYKGTTVHEEVEAWEAVIAAIAKAKGA